MVCDGKKHGSPLSTTYTLQANRESKVPLGRMARATGWLCKGAIAQPPHLGILGGGVTWVWDTLIMHVRGLGHSTLMGHAMGNTTKEGGEMKVWVRCARGVQVAYVTLHHRGCTLVLPSTWAKQVPRVCHTPWHAAVPGQSFAEEFSGSLLSSLVTKRGQNRGAVTIDHVDHLYQLISI